LLAEGRNDQAMQYASAAANREDAIDKHPVTPGEVIPARELYADMLFELNKNADSLEQYRIVLTGSPNRLNALLGAASAASHTGDVKLAEIYYAKAREQTQSGNRQRTGLDRAWIAAR
jgi:tetratricopeptide (TPR) repeat protein